MRAVRVGSQGTRLLSAIVVAIALVGMLGGIARAATPPGVPTSVTAVAGNASATVSWTAPASDGGSPITGYTVTPFIGATPVTSTTYNSTVTTQVVTGLGNGVTYRFRVAAINAIGTGSNSVASNAVTPVTTPGMPTGVTATPGMMQATVSWTAPVSTGGAAITGYRVTPFIGASAQTATTFNSTATTQIVTGLTNGTSYTFRVAAINSVGTGPQSMGSSPVTPASPPGAPTIGTASSGNTQATVTWTAPASNGGSAITGYTVTPFIGASAQTATTFNSTATTQIVTGLTNGTSYTFKVAAVNAIGTGSQSAASNAVTPSPSAPGSPTGVTAVGGNSSAIVSWTAPASNGGSPITGYTVTPFVGFVALTPTTYNSPATTETVTGLTNGTTYRFKVAAINAVGTGNQSAASNAVTPAPVVPGAPTIGTAVAGPGEATVSWTAPGDDGGSPITGYQVTPYIGLTAQAPVVFNSTATTEIVTGLTNGTTYTFTVAAINGVGTGPDSAQSNAVTPATVPDPPTIGTATRGPGEATLTWTAPAFDGGAAITGYVVTPYIGATAQTPVVFNSTATTQAITGLTNGTTYTLTVAAINSVGTGDPSAASNPVTPATVPDPPTGASATGGNAQATVSWTAPAFDGGAAISGYEVTPYIGATAQTPVVFNSTATTQVITGLANGTTYTFTVEAINDVGTGGPSAATNAVTPMTVPNAPTIGTAINGDARATVNWTAPAFDGGSPITGYEVTPYIGAVAQTPVVFNSVATTETVTGLTNGITYTFKVAAINVVGTGLQSAASNAVTPVITAAAEGGAAHTCALLPDTTVACWGLNSSGQIGDGTTTSRAVPTLVPGLSGVQAIALGGAHTCALLVGGTVKCWGSNSDGQLGDGTQTTRLTPTLVSGLSGAISISTFNLHTCARLSSGTVKCWGYNGHGEVGDGTTITRRLPTTVSGLSGVSGVSAGSWHTCARLSNGTVKCWGSNTRGQLGDGTSGQRTTPVDVLFLSTASAVTALGSSTCAITPGGLVSCWGLNHHGQLGDGTVVNRFYPVAVLNLSGAGQVAGGLYHACARVQNGTVKCWGYNSSGQLGNNSTTERHTPITVPNLTGVISIAAGSNHSIARLTNGALRTWGMNSSGQLGDNSAANSTVPVPVSTLG